MRGTNEKAERAVILQLLRSDRPEVWARAELEREVAGLGPLTVSDALAHLQAEGVAILDCETVQASRCAWHMDYLGLVSI